MIVELHPKQIKPICTLYSIVDPLPVEGVACSAFLVLKPLCTV
jgi:hypothetical protein